jgi:alpha-amylase
MSSYAFDTRDKPPPADVNGNIISPSINPDGSCGNGWICEHRWKAVSSMVKFKAVVEGTVMENWWTNDNNQIAFSRGSKGFVVFNLDNDMINVKIKTSLPSGKYCDIITGNLNGRDCSGKSVVVKADGTVEITLLEDDENGVIAIHIEERVSYYDYFRYIAMNYRH